MAEKKKGKKELSQMQKDIVILYNVILNPYDEFVKQEIGCMAQYKKIGELVHYNKRSVYHVIAKAIKLGYKPSKQDVAEFKSRITQIGDLLNEYKS